MVKNCAFVASANTNPFHFHNYDMTNLVLYVSEVYHPSEPLNGLLYGLWKYQNLLFSSAVIHHDDHAHTITLEMFTKCLYVLGFDLTPDREADEEHVSLPSQRNVRIEAPFKKTSTRTCHVHFVCRIPRTRRN
jgi:hypothetical protein